MRDNNISHFSESKTIQILKQIRDGFEELRRRGVIHRDLKLSNIFLHDERVIIGKESFFLYFMTFLNLRGFWAGQDRKGNDWH